MTDGKIDGKAASLIARKYFEEIVFNTTMLQFEVKKVSYNKDQNIWNLEVAVAPFYTNKKDYKLEIDGTSGDVKNVEQTPTTPRS